MLTFTKLYTLWFLASCLSFLFFIHNKTRTSLLSSQTIPVHCKHPTDQNIQPVSCPMMHILTKMPGQSVAKISRFYQTSLSKMRYWFLVNEFLKNIHYCIFKPRRSLIELCNFEVKWWVRLSCTLFILHHLLYKATA